MSESEAAHRLTVRILAELEQKIIGQQVACRRLLAAYLGGGHTLLEGAPGIGKTQLARSFAAVLGHRFQRIQFTPDLMPTDVIGNNVYSQESASFRLIRGPIFTQILMADEINRTPPKTQAALLEAMQERQVTIDGVRYRLDPGFFVVATQNPVEFEGTYRLPEAQLDRFAIRIEMTHPDPTDELDLYRRSVAGTLPVWSEADDSKGGLSSEESLTLTNAIDRVHVDDGLLEYLVELVGQVRGHQAVELAVSPRAALSLVATARGAAVLAGRSYVTPGDLKSLLEPCWAHRLMLTAEAELEGVTTGRVLRHIADTVEVPR